MMISLRPAFRRPALIAALAIAAVAGGCAGDSNIFSTGSLSEPAPATKVAADPACVTLAAQIDGLRQDGATDRLEKAAEGKTTTVTVQRASLAKQAQLNKANADFVAKCAPNVPKTATAPVKPAVAKKTAELSGVTVAAPASSSIAAPKSE
jgi:hypothetical protein